VNGPLQAAWALPAFVIIAGGAWFTGRTGTPKETP
jgi:hypothetical protein